MKVVSNNNYQVYTSFRNKESYIKAQAKREKLWEQTHFLDDIGTLGLCSGLLCKTFSQTSKTKNFIGNSFLIVGIIAILVAMIKRAVLARKIEN